MLFHPSPPAQDCTRKRYAATGWIAAGRVMPLTRPTACGCMINAPKAGRCEYQRKTGTLHRQRHMLLVMLSHQLVEKLLLYKTIQSTICNMFF